MFNYIHKKIEFVFNNPSSIGANKIFEKVDVDFVIKKNLIVIYCAIICFVATIYYSIISEKIEAAFYLIATIIMMIIFMVNDIKQLYFFKFISVFLINIGILYVCVYFKRSEFYVFCFFIIIYISNIVFSYNKLIYLIILTVQSFVFIFIIHSQNTDLITNHALENNIVPNFIFMILLFLGVSVIASKINYFNDLEYIKDKAKLYKINKSLLQINTEIDQLNVAGLHSMKTPLYVAEDFIKQLHQSKFQTKNNSEDYVQLIKNSIQLSEMYIQNLFTYDELITNTSTLERFNILEKIKFVTEIAVKKHNNVSISIDCNDIEVCTNEFCFLVIIENLITNGLKYNNSEHKKILISVRKSKYETVIHVNDNGIGIEPIYFNRIFKPFVRINQNITVDGTGLGLSSVKIAAQKIKGNVKVLESSIKGTTFEVKFKNN